MNLKLLSSVAFAATIGFASAAYADITIGVIAPLTGPVAAFGDQVKKARKPPWKSSTRLAASRVRKSS